MGVQDRARSGSAIERKRAQFCWRPRLGPMRYYHVKSSVNWRLLAGDDRVSLQTSKTTNRRNARMKLTPKQKAIIENLGAVLSGLQVPMSIAGPQMLGTAYEPLVKLRDQLDLRGWPDSEQTTEALAKALE
jgi:hypothetical protein